MSPFSFLRSVYTLDTLDTRFTTPSATPYKTVIDSRGDEDTRDAQKEKIASRAPPSKWNTPEFYLYLTVVCVCVPLMLWIPYTVSRPSDPRYHKYEHRLTDGWVPGRKIDNTDSQYRSFRQNVPYLAVLLVFHPLLRRLWNKFKPLPHQGKTPLADQAEARLEQRASFDYTFAMIFLAALHGFSMFKVIAILWINYNIATGLPRRFVPLATWVFNIGTLFANELCQGYHYRDIAAVISGTSPFLLRTVPVHNALVDWGMWMDSWGGIMGRWEVLFNITVLRLISFNLDYYWSLDYRGASPIEKQLDPAALSERDRVTIPASKRDYSFRNYLAYALYAPLYLTGPILTFNDYISQLRYRPHSIETNRTVRYAVRFLLCLLCMELILHFVYVGAISSSLPVWDSYTPAQLSLLSFQNIIIIWLKLLLPWRFFRLWSLTDGIDPPENMVRCVTNNFSTLSFWRGWHRSYNKWLIRYIWIPLGGASFATLYSSLRSIAGYLIIFTFVALWHDIKLRLLIWAWLIVLFILPEVLAKTFVTKKLFGGNETRYRMVCCLGGAANTQLMMAANLVGFAFGLDGLQSILSGIFQSFSGILFYITACWATFTGVQVMFEIRESEARKGISLKC